MTNQNPAGNQGKQANQQNDQRGNSANPGREINPARPSGEPGKLPQNAGNALDANKGGTATQHGQQSKSQSAQPSSSQTMKGGEAQDERNGPSQGAARPGDQKQGAGTSRNTQDEDKPSGISQAVKKGEDGAGDLGAEDDETRTGKFPGREKGAM